MSILRQLSKQQVEELFSSQIQKQLDSDCWNWMGALAEGIPVIKIGCYRGLDRYISCYVYAWSRKHDKPFSDRVYVYPMCGNFHCVNPDHLKECSKTEHSFWMKIDKLSSPSACWLWIGAKTAQGYATFGTKGKAVHASRYSWELFNGKIPNGCFVCHKCDRPECVNPYHLFVGTPKDNVQDMISKGRAAWQKDKPIERQMNLL